MRKTFPLTKLFLVWKQNDSPLQLLFVEYTPLPSWDGPLQLSSVCSMCHDDGAKWLLLFFVLKLIQILDHFNCHSCLKKLKTQ